MRPPSFFSKCVLATLFYFFMLLEYEHDHKKEYLNFTHLIIIFWQESPDRRRRRSLQDPHLPPPPRGGERLLPPPHVLRRGPLPAERLDAGEPGGRRRRRRRGAQLRGSAPRSRRPVRRPGPEPAAAAAAAAGPHVLQPGATAAGVPAGVSGPCRVQRLRRLPQRGVRRAAAAADAVARQDVPAVQQRRRVRRLQRLLGRQRAGVRLHQGGAAAAAGILAGPEPTGT